MEEIDHAFQFLPCLVQEREVLGVLDVGRGADRVQDSGSFVPTLVRSFFPFALARFIFFPECPEKDFVGLDHELVAQTFAESDKCRVAERPLALEGMEAEEVLEVRVFHNLAGKAAVGEVLAFLDDERGKRHAERLCGTPGGGREEFRVALFHRIPRDAVRKPDPFVGRIQLHSAGLVEVHERDLVFGLEFVHGARS